MARNDEWLTLDAPDEQLTLDAPAVFRMLGISKNTGYSLIQRNEFPLPIIRAGRRILVPKAAIQRLLMGEENG